MLRLLLSSRALLERPQGAEGLSDNQAILFAYLAIAGATPRSRLAGLLWPDVEEARARANLRQLLHRLGPLRPALSPDDPLELSPELAVSYADDPKSLLADHDYSDRPELQRWLDDARDRLRQRQLAAAVAGLERAERSADAAALNRYAERILQLDPYSEARVRQLVALLLRLGDAAAAHHLFRRSRQRIAGALDLEPESVLPQVAALLEAGSDRGLEQLLEEAEVLQGRDREAALLRLDASRRAWQVGWRRAVEIGDAALLAEAAEPLALYFEHRAQAYEGLRLLMDAVVRLEVRDDLTARRARGRALVHAAWLRHRLGLAALESAASGVEVLRDTGDIRHLTQGLYALGAAHWYAGDTAAAQAAWAEADSWVQRVSDPAQLKHLHGNLAMAADALGDFERARHHYQAALDLHRRSDEMGGTVPYLNNLGQLLVSIGRTGEGEAMLRQGLQLAQTYEGQSYLLPYLLDSLANCAVAGRRFAEAEALLDEAEALSAAEQEDRYLRIDMRTTRLRLAVAAGEGTAADALTLLDAAWTLGYRPAVNRVLLLLAQLLRAVGAPAGAEPILASLQRYGDAGVRAEAERLLAPEADDSSPLPLARLVPALLDLDA